MKRMMFVIASLIVVGSSALHANASQSTQNVGRQTHPKQPEWPKQEKSYKGLKASLSFKKKDYIQDERMDLTVSYTASTQSHRILNPFFDGLLDYPGELLIRDRRGKVVRRLYQHHRGSMRSPKQRDYVLVDLGRSVSKTLDINPSRDFTVNQPLSPGRYSIQLVLYSRLLPVRGDDKTNTLRDKGRTNRLLYNDRTNTVVASKQTPFLIVSGR